MSRPFPLDGARAFLAAALGILFVGPALADTDVDVSAYVRTRYEADDRTFAEQVDMDHTVYQSSRVRLDVEHGDGAEMVVEIQDSRIWGQEGSTTADTQNVDLRQGFLRFHPWGIGRVDAGRQVLKYGREHVIGDAGFEHLGRSFDAVKIHTDFSSAWLDLVVGKVSEESVTGVDENVAAAILNLDFDASGFELQPLVLYKETSVPSQYLTALGAYAHWARDGFFVDGDAVIQTGKASGADISAHLVALDVGRDFSADADNTSGATVGAAMYSGDEPGDDEFSAYDQLYPTNHRYYGIMDIADSITNGLALGLVDVHAMIWFAPTEGAKFSIGGSLFRTDVDTDLASGRNGKDLGKELDIVLEGRLADGITLEVGGGYFLSGDVVEAAINEENATWGYLQATGSF